MRTKDGRSTSSRGKLLSQILEGAWRSKPPTNSADELAEIAELALRSGAGGLVWCKIRDSALQASSVADELRQGYWLHSIQAALHERTLEQVLPLMRSHGVEPVLVKGWSVARHYREPGMRPYGDVDLCVLPEQYVKAKLALTGNPLLAGEIDLHDGFDKFYDWEVESTFARTELVRLGDLEVRVLSAEDHLRFLCLHLLRHGAVRPLWLCDIAVLLEGLSDQFRWDRCLGGSPRRANWVACAIGLAHQLLGVDIEDTPVAHRARNLPKWLVPTVLEEWGKPFVFHSQVASFLRHPVKRIGGLLRELPRHWPNPITATMTVQGPFNGLPRLPFQCGHVVSRTAALLAQLPRILKAV